MYEQEILRSLVNNEEDYEKKKFVRIFQIFNYDLFGYYFRKNLYV